MIVLLLLINVGKETIGPLVPIRNTSYRTKTLFGSEGIDHESVISPFDSIFVHVEIGPGIPQLRIGVLFCAIDTIDKEQKNNKHILTNTRFLQI